MYHTRRRLEDTSDHNAVQCGVAGPGSSVAVALSVSTILAYMEAMVKSPSRPAARLRLDQLMLERGLAATRAKAQALIMAGEVFSGETRLDKPGSLVRADLALAVRDSGSRWVSRGAHKLLAGLDHFAIDPAGLAAIDVGASTGGFTHVLLAHGAGRVHAVDVGHGQLDWQLRQDPRVHVLERTNARHLSAGHIPEPVDLVVCDASFIGLRTVLPASLALTRAEAFCIALIKPQFEVGPKAARGGVVRDPAVHEAIKDEIAAWFDGLEHWSVEGIVESPIRGPKGNREFLIGVRRRP